MLAVARTQNRHFVTSIAVDNFRAWRPGGYALEWMVRHAISLLFIRWAKPMRFCALRGLVRIVSRFRDVDRRPVVRTRDRIAFSVDRPVGPPGRDQLFDLSRASDYYPMVFSAPRQVRIGTENDALYRVLAHSFGPLFHHLARG